MSAITARSVFRWEVSHGKKNPGRFGAGPEPVCHPTKKHTRGRLRHWKPLDTWPAARYAGMLDILIARANGRSR